MSLDGALSIANGGLANINRQMALVSQNVANASTPGIRVEISTQQSMTADGMGLGVRSGPAIRNIDTALQAEVFSQNATVAGLQTRQTALQAIDAVQGTPGQGSDIASLLGKLQNQFSTLLNSPDSPPQQSQVVSTADSTLAQGINTLSNAYTAQRQTAQKTTSSPKCHAEHHPRHHRRPEQPDRHAEGERPEHRRSGEPARCRGGEPVATGRHEDARAAERRPADRDQPPASTLPIHGTANPVLDQ